MDLKSSTIGVLMGGLSGEREVSLRSGENCAKALESLGYKVIRIDAVRDVALRVAEARLDVAFLALHGRYGEDGTIQGLLEILGIPYTGSRVLASALGMHKPSAKKVVASAGVATPGFYEVGTQEPAAGAASCIISQLGLPVMLKPAEEGSSLGVCKCADHGHLTVCIEEGRRQYGSVFAESFISGAEVTVGVLMVDGALRALPVLELVPKREFYDYEAKYTKGLTKFILPARLVPQVYARTQETAVETFEALGCRGYARVDMIVDQDGTPWFVEINTLPGMTELSDLPAQAAAAGIPYPRLVELILFTAVEPSP